jgi:hypothetical protein
MYRVGRRLAARQTAGNRCGNSSGAPMGVAAHAILCRRSSARVECRNVFTSYGRLAFVDHDPAVRQPAAGGWFNVDLLSGSIGAAQCAPEKEHDELEALLTEPGMAK